MANNRSCKHCGKAYHHCGSCGDDFFSGGYDEDEYCSTECYKMSEEYKAKGAEIAAVWNRASEEERKHLITIFEESGEYGDDDDREAVVSALSETSPKLAVAAEKLAEDGYVNYHWEGMLATAGIQSKTYTASEKVVDTYKGFDIVEVTREHQYPGSKLTCSGGAYYYGVSKERGVRTRDYSHFTYGDDKRTFVERERAAKSGTYNDAYRSWTMTSKGNIRHPNDMNLYSFIDILTEFDIRADTPLEEQHKKLIADNREIKADVAELDNKVMEAYKKVRHNIEEMLVLEMAMGRRSARGHGMMDDGCRDVSLDYEGEGEAEESDVD